MTKWFETGNYGDMVKNILLVLVTSAITSGIWILCTKAGARWYSRDYTCVVLTDDVVLKADTTNEVLGTLKKGVVLFVPDGADYQVTDPGDTSLHKIYIGLTADMDGKFLRVPQDLSPTNTHVTAYNYLDVYPKESTAAIIRSH